MSDPDTPQHAARPALPVLVIEDEASIAKGLCDALDYHGYRAVCVGRGDAGLETALRDAFSLVILDVMLPALSGFDVCEGIRAQRPDLPILMLTARGAEGDVLRGFRAGCDDYVTKPFSVAELIARVEALLRRSRQAPDARFRFGPFEVDPERLEASGNGRRLSLSRREVMLLSAFVRERGRVVSRRSLLRDLWGFRRTEKVETRTVDVHIAKLRRKLAPEADRLIETVRGEGYRYRESA